MAGGGAPVFCLTATSVRPLVSAPVPISPALLAWIQANAGAVLQVLGTPTGRSRQSSNN